MSDIEITIKYNDKEYKFDYGVKAYIFHTGIYNGISIDTLPDYIELVFACYIADDNRTNVGALADYIADEWERLKNKPIRIILDEFYNEGDY